MQLIWDNLKISQIFPFIGNPLHSVREYPSPSLEFHNSREISKWFYLRFAESAILCNWMSHSFVDWTRNNCKGKSVTFPEDAKMRKIYMMITIIMIILIRESWIISIPKYSPNSPHSSSWPESSITSHNLLSNEACKGNCIVIFVSVFVSVSVSVFVSIFHLYLTRIL